ncbi:F25A4.4 [Salix viminalis]|uniref:F25A4.4 n=1 Tax=Salix viminalis TaxID=40686 RepID=A0A9Q0SFB9_SALVM|nr:F25A4.4 [Salix viminalis]
MRLSITQSTKYWLSEHPSIVNFRWSPTESWGSTWSFLFSAIAIYIIAAAILHLMVSLTLRTNRRVPLGPIPAIHSLAMAMASVLAPLFPSRHPTLWPRLLLSFQILAILSTTLLSSVVYGYRFWTAIGLPSACFPFVVSCQVVLLGCNLVCHFGVLSLHLLKGGGCNGIGAWGLNSMLNAVILLLFLKFYLKMYLSKRKGDSSSEFKGSSRYLPSGLEKQGQVTAYSFSDYSDRTVILLRTKRKEESCDSSNVSYFNWSAMEKARRVQLDPL